MLKTNQNQHIKNFKHILYVWFIFFALSPCVVKEAMFSVVNAEYSQPLNKSKTTAPTNYCQYSQEDSQQISIIKLSKIDRQTEPVITFKNLFFIVHSHEIITNYSKVFSGNSPPKYILYKRLKLDVA